MFPKVRSPEYADKINQLLQLARRALQEKLRAERQAKAGSAKHGRIRFSRKRSDPPISAADKYDPRGRAPLVAEPREKDKGVIKVRPRRENK